MECMESASVRKLVFVVLAVSCHMWWMWWVWDVLTWLVVSPGTLLAIAQQMWQTAMGAVLAA